MKPPVLDYRRPASVVEALELLADDTIEAKVIAGGQSLTPMLNLRLARPELLVDIGRLPGLRYIAEDDGGLRVGALARHDQFEQYPSPLGGFEILREVAPLIGHHPIRTRGTIGGSLAHADGAAEWCLLAVLLDAEVVARSVRGERTIVAGELFQGLFTTALEEDELIVEVRFPRPRPHAALEEFARRHGDFAIVAVAVAFDLDGDRMGDPRVVIGGVSSAPQRCEEAESVLDGARLTRDTLTAAGSAAAGSVDPPGDLHATSEVRRRMVDNLLRRAISRAGRLEELSHAG